eukprot:g4525.t1
MSASRLSRSLNVLLACCTPFASVFLLSSWVAVEQVAPVSAQKYIIGDTFMSGAFNISEKSVECTSPNAPCGFNLEAGCFMGKRYSFVNHANNDNGVVVQHKGGLFGAVGVAQYGVGNCFCYTTSKLLCGQR